MTRKTIGLFLFWGATLAAQTSQIAGTVIDSTESRIPGASVSALNKQTGLRRDVSSNAEGGYVIALLPPGSYEVSVSKEGFRSVRQTDLSLSVDDAARLDFKLEIGLTSQTVDVSATLAVLETESGALRRVIEQRQILDLPLNGRNAGELVFLTPGAIRDTRTAGTYVYGSSIVPDTQTPAINGSRSNGVAFRLDGANNNDNYTGVSNPFPNPDALQEFSIQTNSFSAEFGNAPGGVVNIRTKSGTNAFHGTAFEFLRNGAMNARNFFAARTDNLKRNQFGGAVGGPLVRNKIFFFGSYQATRTRATQNGLTQFVPTDAMRRGDFSAVSGRLTDPLTGIEFPGRQLPANRMDPVAVKLMEYMPHSSLPSGQVFYSLPNRSDFNEFLLKGDQTFGKHTLYQRYYEYDLDQPALFSTPNILTQLYDGRSIRAQSLAANDVYAISPTLVNSLTFTWAHNRGGSVPSAPFGLADLGAKVAQPEIPALGISIAGYAGITTTQRARITRDNLEFADTLSWFRGKHQVVLGGYYLRMRQDINNDFRKNASFSFTNDFTGNSVGNYLLGLSTQFLQGGGEFKALRGGQMNFFVQDNYRVSSSLSLNLGIRLDPWTPYYDDLDRITCYAPGARSNRYPNAPRGLIYAGDADCPRGGVDSKFIRLAPRLGFAWSPGKSRLFSVRGGYGVFFEQPETVLYNRFVNTAPFSPNILLTGVSLSDPYRGTTNPFPAKYGPRNPPSSETFELPVLSTTFATGFLPQYTQNWNFTLERQFGASSVMRLSYVGSKGTKLRTNVEANPAIYNPSATTGNTQLRRLNPQFSSIISTMGAGNSTYHSLQLSFERRLTKSFTATGSYVWSKSIDYSSSNTTQGSSNVPNPFDIRANRGPSDFDVRHRVVLSTVYALPALAGASAPLRLIAGNWQVSGIGSWQSGFPFSVTSGVDNARSGVGADRADYSGGVAALSPNRPTQDMLSKYFDSSVFRANALGTFGNSGRNILTGPGSFNLDVGLQKYFVITEKMKFQLRGEAFNFTNTPTFSLPGSNLTATTTLGRITSAGAPRILQVAVKFIF